MAFPEFKGSLPHLGNSGGVPLERARRTNGWKRSISSGLTEHWGPGCGYVGGQAVWRLPTGPWAGERGSTFLDRVWRICQQSGTEESINEVTYGWNARIGGDDRRCA